MLRKSLLIALILISSICITNAAQTVTKKNFAEPIIQPKLKRYYTPGEKISFNYTIEPKTADDAELIDGRVYEFNTSLENPQMRVTVEYGGSGPVRIYDDQDYIKANVRDWTDGGVIRIFVQVSGEVPAVSGRVVEVTALGIDIQDAESGALNNVIINVVNKNTFESFIKELKSRYSEIKKMVSDLEAKGVVVGEIKSKLNTAKDKIDEGEIFYKNGDYLTADAALSDAEKLLDDASDLAKKTDARHEIDVASQKVEKMFGKMTELEVLIRNLKEKGEATLSYEVKLEEYKNRYSDLSSRITQAENYMSQSLYDDAKSTASEIIKIADESMAEIEELIGEMSSKLEVTPTPTQEETATPEKTPEAPSATEKLYESLSNIKAWIAENSRLLIMFVVGAVVLGVGGYFGYRGLKGYMKKKKWDELR